MGSCGNILQHKCFENYSEEVHALHIDKNHVARMVPRSNENEDPSNATVIPPGGNEQSQSVCDDIDEILIEMVFQKPALWNHKLPLHERTQLKVNALWLEVSNAMGGGKATPKWAKTRWKDLRDSYVKARKKQKAYVPSGSDADTAQRLRSSSFRFFKRMQFLEVAYATEPTISSLDSTQRSLPIALDANTSSSDSAIYPQTSAITVPQITRSPLSPIIIPSGPSSAPLPSSSVATITTRPGIVLPKNKRKREDSDGQSNLQESILEALREPIKQPDAVDGVLLMLGEGLRRLPYRERTVLEVKWLGELLNAEERCSSQND